jgi:hypothetical protein
MGSIYSNASCTLVWLGDTRLSNVVYILASTNVLFILRKHGEMFSLMSECYVDEIMGGKGIEAMKDGEAMRGLFDVKLVVGNVLDFVGFY